MTRDLAWLHDALDAVDLVFWDHAMEARGIEIVWMRWRRTKKTFRFGAFDRELKRIEINPILSAPWVPTFVVMSTVHHESCHAMLRDVHDDAFNLAAHRFPYALEAEVWCAEHLNDLIAATPPAKESK